MNKDNKLGMGLGALLSTNTNNDNQGVKKINISQIIPNPSQPRKNFIENELKELSLSIKRAEVVKEILINYGINQSSIKILGKGEESLAVDTPDDTKQPANRRVEIKKTN